MTACPSKGHAISANFSFGVERTKLLRETLVSAADVNKQRYFGEASDRLKKEFFWMIEDMVRLMPKQEMANLAEALVNITIIKRKASAELATVGGPIDVAVISRHEGFVWAKRKHCCLFDRRAGCDDSHHRRRHPEESDHLTWIVCHEL